MKKCLLLCALPIFGLAACDNAPTPGTPVNTIQPVAAAPAPVQAFRGLYRSGDTGRSFYDCGNGKTYRVIAQPAVLDSLYAEACAPAPCKNESVYAVVQGRVAPAGLPAFAGDLEMSAIDTLSAKTMYNTCLPFDFWCSGTEPFWALYISEKDGGFFVKIIGEETGYAFPWSAPVRTGDAWVYASVDAATHKSLNVTVRKAPCSDGMSDRAYSYSVQMTLDNQVFKGCAVRYGAVPPRE